MNTIKIINVEANRELTLTSDEFDAVLMLAHIGSCEVHHEEGEAVMKMIASTLEREVG